MLTVVEVAGASVTGAAFADWLTKSRVPEMASAMVALTAIAPSAV